MRKVLFEKLSGAGNDFILIDAGKQSLSKSPSAIAQALCPRRHSIGADGLLLIRRVNKDISKLDYYNADGSRAFCGNGARCAAAWAHRSGWHGKSFSLKTIEGSIKARILSKRKARIRLPGTFGPVRRLKLNIQGKTLAVASIKTGVPHAVVRITPAQLKTYPVLEIGRALRWHRAFAPRGANANFMSLALGKYRLRTYERGVESETQACGTGAAAAALTAAALWEKKSPIHIKVQSGDTLTIHFRRTSNDLFDEVWLEGPVRSTYKGEVTL